MTKFISLKTSLPGPKSQEIAKQREKHIAKPMGSSLSPCYIAHGEGANELRQQDVTISETFIYNILCRKQLNHRIDRLFYAQEKSDNPVVTERYLREVEKRKENHIHAYYSGYLFCQDTFYVGTIKGLGRIYQQTGVDAYAGFGFVRELIIPSNNDN